MTLDRLGLTPDQERVYRWLLLERNRTAALAPADRLVLGELRKLGLLDDDLSAVSPVTAVDVLVRRRLSEAQRQFAELGAAWDALREWGEEHRTGKPAGSVEFLPGGGESGRRIQRLLAREPDELLSIQADSRHRPFWRTLAGYERQLAAGLRSRVIFPIDAMEDPAQVAHARRRHALGELHRATTQQIGPLAIVNRSVVFVATGPGDDVIQIRHTGLARLLVGVFDRMWALAHDVAEPPFSPTELRVLHALTCHDTDESAARSINISVRKFRAHVAAVMDRLGARTRFQAALLVKEKGLI